MLSPRDYKEIADAIETLWPNLTSEGYDAEVAAILINRMAHGAEANVAIAVARAAEDQRNQRDP